MLNASAFYIRNGVYYFDITYRGKRIRRSTRRKSLEAAMVYARRVLREEGVRAEHGQKVPPRKIDESWEATVEAGLEKSDSWLRLMAQRCKDRSARRGAAYSLTIDDLRDMALKSGGKCAVSGCDFNWDRVNDCTMPPYAPSIDRIDPKQGYKRTNCRLVCQAVNMAMSDWGEEVLFDIASAISERALQGLV